MLLMPLGAAVLGGCASIVSLKTTPRPGLSERYHARQIYGGTRIDCSEIGGCIPGPPWAYALAVPFIVDLPLSFVVDTAAVPFTVPYNLINSKTTNTANQALQAIGASAPQPER